MAKVSALTRQHALARARAAMPLEAAERLAAWSRLEADFGYTVAAAAWREARHEVGPPSPDPDGGT